MLFSNSPLSSFTSTVTPAKIQRDKKARLSVLLADRADLIMEELESSSSGSTGEQPTSSASLSSSSTDTSTTTAISPPFCLLCRSFGQPVQDSNARKLRLTAPAAADADEAQRKTRAEVLKITDVVERVQVAEVAATCATGSASGPAAATAASAGTATAKRSLGSLCASDEEWQQFTVPSLGDFGTFEDDKDDASRPVVSGRRSIFNVATLLSPEPHPYLEGTLPKSLAME
ncbi:hypothetical protein GALMADRAFT_145544 [Galerina marginata CBS 339.88]|uniref:Uncharacterized protein n=1 Tax=Galerina marginata (strain CBS 339.88) TaxID=685588 RepID=A0A067SPB5_GALM3|nr:hypothetical protein GALMADRAFT_145544 [Galerina marginata CBS 339.88]